MRRESWIEFPNACCSSTGRPLIHGLTSFSNHSPPPHSLSLPITPCCRVPPPSSPSSIHTPSCILSGFFHSSILPCGSILRRHHLAPTCSFSNLHLFLLPPSLVLFLYCGPSQLPFPRSLPYLIPLFLSPPLPCRTLGMTAPCTLPRWQPSIWETTVAMPTAMKTSIRHMCCRWMVSNGCFLPKVVYEVWT